jgi:outer membrane receptor protein involved in Fe transport
MQAAAVLAVAGALVAAPARAQESAAGDTASEPDGIIVVTAQKRAENLQDVPIAISALGSSYLEARGISSIDNIGALAPNVKFERAPASGTIAQIAIRGSVTINPAVTWEPAVGLYLDGVYIAKNQGAIFDVADLERVEILRGPQGTLYGRNSLAGAVNLVTAKPSGKLGGKLELSYGDYDYKRARAVLDLPAVGPFSVKLSGQITKRDGFVDVVDNPFPAAAPFARPASTSQAQSLDGRFSRIYRGAARSFREPSKTEAPQHRRRALLGAFAHLRARADSDARSRRRRAQVDHGLSRSQVRRLARTRRFADRHCAHLAHHRHEQLQPGTPGHRDYARRPAALCGGRLLL